MNHNIIFNTIRGNRKTIVILILAVFDFYPQTYITAIGNLYGRQNYHFSVENY